MKRKSKIFTFFILLLLLLMVCNAVSICTFASQDQKQKADVAIVLGAQASSTQVSPVYQERINHAITLYREGYVGRLIVTGGVTKGNTHSDAYYAKQYAISQGVPPEAILTEDTSTITQQNLENAKTIMDQNGYTTAIIVSDPLHMRRAMLLAKDTGITAYTSPTPTSRYLTLKTKIPFLLRETFFYTGYQCCRIVRLIF